MKIIRKVVEMCMIGVMVWALVQVKNEIFLHHMHADTANIYWGIFGYELLFLAAGFATLFFSGKTKFKQPPYSEG